MDFHFDQDDRLEIQRPLSTQRAELFFFFRFNAQLNCQESKGIPQRAEMIIKLELRGPTTLLLIHFDPWWPRAWMLRDHVH